MCVELVLCMVSQVNPQPSLVGLKLEGLVCAMAWCVMARDPRHYHFSGYVGRDCQCVSFEEVALRAVDFCVAVGCPGCPWFSK